LLGDEHAGVNVEAKRDDAEPTEDESAGGDTAASIDPLEDDALWGIDGATSQRRQAAFPEMRNNRRRRRRGRGALARGEARTRILGVRAVMLVQWRAAHVRAAQIGACGTKLRRRRPKRIAKLEKNTIIAFELNTKKKID
jgi:hypothetical protein